MAHWMNYTCIKFKVRENEKDYIKFVEIGGLVGLVMIAACIVTIWIHALLGSCQVQEHVDVWMWGLGHCSQLKISLSAHLVILQVLV